MLIIGTMEWTSNRGNAYAYCPNCGVQQIFQQRSSRPFLTLYFIPCVPLGRNLEYLQCTVCKGTFGVELLQLSQHIQEHTEIVIPFDDDLCRAMATIMLADKGIEEVEISAAQFAFTQLMGRELLREELGIMCDEVNRMRLTTNNFLRQSRRRWDAEQKTKILQAMFWTASATGTLSPQRTAALLSLAKLLDFDENNFQEIVAQTFEWQPPPKRRRV